MRVSRLILVLELSSIHIWKHRLKSFLNMYNTLLTSKESSRNKHLNTVLQAREDKSIVAILKGHNYAKIEKVVKF